MKEEEYTTIDNETNSEVNQNAKIIRILYDTVHHTNIISYYTENKNDSHVRITISDEKLAAILDDFIIDYNLSDLLIGFLFDLNYSDIKKMDLPTFIDTYMTLFILDKSDYLDNYDNTYNREDVRTHNNLVNYIIKEMHPVINKFVAELEKIRNNNNNVDKSIIVIQPKDDEEKSE